MAEDIFVPKSKPEDALVGPLHTITYLTADKGGVEKAFRDGYGLSTDGWRQPSAKEYETLNPYFGFSPSDSWEVCAFYKSGEGENVQIRAINIHQDSPLVRPAYEGLYTGGATISFPINDLRTHEKIMSDLGFESTIGVKEMEFASPTGETYISAEIVYKAPDNIFVMGVTRPDIFIPVGPIDPEKGMGGAAYSARCVAEADATVEFFKNVLGYEIRRDVNFVVGERSAINMPEGTTERFIQGFAPGTNTGYVVLMDHVEATKHSPAPSLGPPNRGIVVWSFPSKNLDEVYKRAQGAGVEIMHAPNEHNSPCIPGGRSMLMKDPDGFPIEIFEE